MWTSEPERSAVSVSRRTQACLLETLVHGGRGRAKTLDGVELGLGRRRVQALLELVGDDSDKAGLDLAVQIGDRGGDLVEEVLVDSREAPRNDARAKAGRSPRSKS
jgi:hypothetical protein